MFQCRKCNRYIFFHFPLGCCYFCLSSSFLPSCFLFFSFSFSCDETFVCIYLSNYAHQEIVYLLSLYPRGRAFPVVSLAESIFPFCNVQFFSLFPVSPRLLGSPLLLSFLPFIFLSSPLSLPYLPSSSTTFPREVSPFHLSLISSSFNPSFLLSFPSFLHVTLGFSFSCSLLPIRA